MSRKDYIRLAAAVSHALSAYGANSAAQQALTLVAETVADTCRDDNPRFDRARFMRACGFAQ